jgi:hypothetical protein
VESDVTVHQVISWIDYAQQHNVWLVLVFHEIQTNPGPYGYTISGLESILSYAVQSGVATPTLAQAFQAMQDAIAAH